MWPAYECNPFSTVDSSNYQSCATVEISRRDVNSGKDGSVIESGEITLLALECGQSAGFHWWNSSSVLSNDKLNEHYVGTAIQNNTNHLIDSGSQSNCRSCPVSSDLGGRYSLLTGHSSREDGVPTNFKRTNSCRRSSSPSGHQDLITRSLPDLSHNLSSVDITDGSTSFTNVNDNIRNAIEINQRIEGMPSASCQDIETSSERTSCVCCEWIQSTTKQEKLILFSLFLVDFTSQMCLSIMAPFFPQEADDKGVNNSISGWIFGVFALTQFITSPIFGKLIPVLGSRFLITSGQFFSSGCIILFGILNYIEPEQEDTFIALCFVLRIALAIGCTAASTASFTITAICFPNSISTIFGLLETATGMGMMLGPALGGFLNQVGGYMLSFVVLGGLMLLTVPLNIVCLPANDFLPARSGTIPLRDLLKIPAVIVVSLGVIMSATVWSILDPTLSVFLANEFQLNSIMMGLLFLLMSCMYAASAPLWGRLADFLNDSLPLMVGGFALSGVGLLLIGPFPLFKIQSELWLVIVSLIVLGASLSLALVPTFDKILEVTEKAGFRDDLTVYGFVAGIWGASFAFGDFVGPVIGGWLLDNQGFDWTMAYTAFACGAMVILILGLILYERKFQNRDNETNACSNSDLPSDGLSDAGTSISETTPLLGSANDRTVATASDMQIPESIV